MLWTAQPTTMNLHKFQSFLFVFSLSVLPLVFVPLGGRTDHFYLPKVIAMGIVLVMFVGSLIIDAHAIKLDRINLALLVYLLWLSFIFLRSNDLELAFLGRPYRHEGYLVLLFYAGFFYLGRLQPRLNPKLFRPILLTALVIALYGSLQTFGLDGFQRDTMRSGWTSAFATLGNPNFVSTYLVMMTLLSLGMYILGGNWLSLGLSGVLSLALILTRTQSGLIGLGVGLGIFYLSLWTQKRVIRRRALISFLIISWFSALAFVTLPSFRVELVNLFKETTAFVQAPFLDETAGSYRIFIWTRVLEIIELRPWFGVGIEHLGRVFNQRYALEVIEIVGQPLLVDRAHNEFLHVAVSVGLPGLALYLNLMVQSLWVSFRKLDLIDLTLFSVVMAYLVQAFFNISVVSVAYLYWAFLGYLSRYEKMR